ncbi:MAG TPA: DegT/DnrJ/EryC1/StrS aminotransferase family protein [Clostridia bacterium]|nr:DegT/DnrJ/EryC1/StrS aminotransferase family protein [Clostridia bacterium]
MKKRDTFLPYSQPYWGKEELEGVQDAIRSNWWSKGPKTIELEKIFARYVGAKYAVAVNSCTAALHTSLVARGIGPGDEVITTPMTFCSSANVIVHTGAKPVFADVDEKTGCISPDCVEAAVTGKTKAVIPVHYAGQPCDMDRIEEIADRNHLFILEDAAHALYTQYKGKMVGSMNTTAFSFYSTKNISTGEGGMLTTNDEDFAEKARVISCHGMSRNAWNRYGKGGSWRYDVEFAGYKYNMTDLQASLGIVQLGRLEAMQQKREVYSRIYDEELSGLPGIRTPQDGGLGRSSRHLYIIRIQKEELDIGRDEFIEELNAMNIGTSVHFIPVHLHPFYQQNYGTRPGDFPVAEKIFEQIISIPLYPSMSEEDVRYVAGAIRDISQKHAK